MTIGIIVAMSKELGLILPMLEDHSTETRGCTLNSLSHKTTV